MVLEVVVRTIFASGGLEILHDVYVFPQRVDKNGVRGCD